MTKWKYLLKEWFFDVHRTLNGTITLIGQSKHIKVGTNVLIPTKVMSETDNINEANSAGLATHILAHVEAISHSFSVDNNGARKFTSTINFVRGILTDSRGRVIDTLAVGAAENNVGIATKGRLDKSTNALPPSKDKNSKTVFGTSDKIDPDPDKLKGE